MVLLLPANAQNQKDLVPTENDSLIAFTGIPVEMDGCIWIGIQGGPLVIRDKKTLNDQIRKNGSYKRCMKQLKDFDFESQSLIGLNLNTGWCRYPLGLRNEFIEIKDSAYLLKIYYNAPGEPCRALSFYDYWIAVPKLPAGYELDILIEPTKN